MLGHNSAMLLLLSLLPATIERPEELREGGATLSELVMGAAKEAEEEKYLVDGKSCGGALCTAPVAGPEVGLPNGAHSCAQHMISYVTP